MTTPLVLVHALNGSPSGWQPVVEALSADHDVHTPAMPGHAGGPPLPGSGPAGVPALADGVEAQMDAAGLDRAHIAGNSLGGWVALELARRGRATSVVGLAPAGGWRSRREMDVVLASLKAGRFMMTRGRALNEPLLRVAPLRKALLATAVRRGDRLPTEAVGPFLDDIAACEGFDRILAWWKTAEPFSTPAAELGCPVRIAWGAKDRTLPFKAFGRPLLDVLGSDADWIMLPGCGHLPVVDDPELVARAILDHTQAADRAAQPA